ncbi:MAG: PAS domain S-box protein [Chloroflexota bacterium]|nr:PAS domain S-box protein [Chloroflexota bacterium]
MYKQKNGRAATRRTPRPISVRSNRQDSPSSGRFFRALVEHSSDAIAMLDPAGTFLYVSPGVTRFLGYMPEELLGRNGFDLVPADQAAFLAGRFATILEAPGGTVVLEHTYRHKDGSVKWLESTLTNLLEEPSVKAVVSNFRDISGRKQTDDALREMARLAAFSTEVGGALIQGDTLSVMLHRCAEAMVKHLDAAFARIWTLQPNDNMLELRASAGMYTHLDGSHSRVHVGEFKIGIIAQEREPHLSNNVLEDPRVHDHDWAEREGMVSFAGYPLLIDDRLVGVMAMFARRPLTPATLDAMASVANGVALGIERKYGEQALVESEARFRFMAETMPQKIFTALPNGDIDYFNPQLMDFTGLSFEEIRAWGWLQIIHPDDAAENVRLWTHSVSTGEPFQFEHRFRRADGTYRWHLSRGVPMRDGKGDIALWIGASTDIDDLKRLQHEAEEAVLARDRFISVASHELKTPVSSIRGYSQLLGRHAEIASNEWTARSLKGIISQADRLTALINVLLDVSRIESGQLHLSLEPVYLPEISEEVVAQVQMLTNHEKHPISMSVIGTEGGESKVEGTEGGLHPWVLADRERLWQVLVNLLENAIKYSPQGGPIELVLTEQGDKAVVSVRDQGIGIPAEQLHRVFERFYRAPNASERNYAGLGLGLNISREIVQRHGGEMWLRSREGEGTTVSFSIPLYTQSTVSLS